MANQDFDINIRVNANTAQVDAIRQSFEKLGAQVKVTNAEMAAGGAAGAGGLGSAAGIGTIISALTIAVNKWQAFEDEQDKIIEKMTLAREKSYELGLEVADMLDAMKSAERIDTEPLQVSFDRLTQKVKVLKGEMKIAFDTGAYEDAKKLAGALRVVESQLDRVTTSIDKQKAAADRLAAANEKAAEKELSAQRDFQQSAYDTASPLTKAVLRNEQASRQALAKGDERSADLFQKSAEGLKTSATPDQQAEIQILEKLTEQNGLLRQQLDLWK
jgi:hypothetical protein